jgi:hypothetical protein
MSALPLCDEDILVYVREILDGIIRSPHVKHLRSTSNGAGREFVTGDTIRDEYVERAGLVLHEAGHVPGAGSWTAALNRLANAGKITKVPLYGSRGARRGHGYRMPRTMNDHHERRVNR